MHADLESIVCKFGGDPTISLGEEAICAKVYRQTDGQTDDRRRAIALAHSWNELNTFLKTCIKTLNCGIDSSKNHRQYESHKVYNTATKHSLCPGNGVFGTLCP